MYYFQGNPANYYEEFGNFWPNSDYRSLNYSYYQKNDPYFYEQHPYFFYNNFQNETIPTYGFQRQNQVDISIFNESIVSYKQLLREASIVLNHLADSKEFATKVMGAAQMSDTKEVEDLIHSLGIKSNFKVTYNPDGIHLKFWSDVKGTECCKLDMAIRWR